MQTQNELARQIQQNVEQALKQAASQRIVVREDALNALRAEIDGTKAEIQSLTQQLTAGISDAKESAITDQIDNAADRLETLQDQYTAALTGRSVAGTAVQPPRPPLPPNVLPSDVRALAIWGMCTLGVTIISVAFIRMWSRWLDRRAHPAPAGADMSPRLDRIEQAIEAVAIEVERISEGQRYANKMMHDSRALPAPGLPERWPAAAEREPVHARPSGEK